jgi:phosphoribosyl 1,2-cyclic phosphate phosphodiesterase
LDDLRAYSYFRDRTLPVWGSSATLQFIRRHFDYIWNARQLGGGLPDLDLRLAASGFQAIGLDIMPIPIKHGKLDILGYRIGDLAYLTDISRLPDKSLPLLAGIRTLVASCVHSRPHPTHLSLAGVKRLHRKLRPNRTILTHISHWFSHRTLLEKLARLDIFPAYDGLKIAIDG